MKLEHNKRYFTIAVYTLLVLLITIVFWRAVSQIEGIVAFFSRVSGFVTPIIYGVVVAFLLNPILRFYEKRILKKAKPKPRRAISMLCTYITAVILVAAFFALIVPNMIASIVSVVDNITVYLKTIDDFYSSFIGYLQQMTSEESNASGIAINLARMTQEGIEYSIQYVVELLTENFSLDSVFIAATGVTTWFVNIVVGIIVSIYILFDRERLFAQMKKIGRALFPQRVYHLLYSIALDINRIFSGFVIGKVIDSIIIGILCLIGMLILKMPYAVLISVIIGVTNFIPYFGPFIGAIPGFILILLVDPIKSLWFLIFILLLQQLDGNVIGPKILGDTVGLSPLWIITSITLFSGLMGIKGMFIGVPLFALLYSLIRRFITFLLDRKGESVRTSDYDSPDNPLPKQPPS